MTVRGPLCEVNLNTVVQQAEQKASGVISPMKALRPTGVESCNELKFDNMNLTLSSPNLPLEGAADATTVPKIRKPKGEFVGVRVTELEDTLRRKSMWRESQKVHKLTEYSN
jgi:hypothetical protein